MSDSSGEVAAEEGSGESQFSINRNNVVVRHDEAVLGVAAEGIEGIQRRSVMTTFGGKRTLNRVPMMLNNNGETQISRLMPPLPSGKIIDIPTTSSSSNNSYNNSSRVSREPQSLDISVINTVVPPSSIINGEAPSGSGSSVPINNAQVPVKVSAIASTSSQTSILSTINSSVSEISTIDTDTDDDVILVAPPLEVIEVDDVDDDDEEDVQIVSHTRSQPIPKPLPVRPNRLMLNNINSNSNNNNHHHHHHHHQQLAPPPVLPPSQFEIDEEIDNNLPVGDILDDLLNSHFGSAIDFELPILDPTPSTSDAATFDQLANAEKVPSFGERIRMWNSIEIQTDTTTSHEVGTQTEPQQVAQKRPWIYDDDDGDGTSCPICLEPWEESGDHRLVALRCGHLFGESCLIKWLNPANTVGNKKQCPFCRSKAMPHHIRPLFARRVVQIKYDKLNEIKSELATYKKRCNNLENQINAMRHQQQPPVPIQLQQIPPPPQAHGPPLTPSGPHATGPFHPTTTTVINPNLSQFPPLDRIQIYQDVRIHDFIRPFHRPVQMHPSYATMEHDFTI